MNTTNDGALLDAYSMTVAEGGAEDLVVTPGESKS